MTMVWAHRDYFSRARFPGSGEGNKGGSSRERKVPLQRTQSFKAGKAHIMNHISSLIYAKMYEDNENGFCRKEGSELDQETVHKPNEPGF